MKFILFDCDGVLVDTEAVAAKVVTQWLETCDCFITENDFIKQHTGKTFGSIFKELVDNGQITKDHWNDQAIRSLEETIYEQITIVEGIPECLRMLEGYEKAVISNSRTEMVKKALLITQLDKFLDPKRIFSAERVEKPKPHPGVYQFALNHFKLNPEECIAIEDSITGVMAATTAGIPTIGFAGASHLQEGHDARLLEAGAVTIAYHAREIPDIIMLK